MGIFNDYMREGRGVDKGPDERPRFIVFFDILFRKFWSLIKVNLLFVLTCIPVVTIGPAIAGMTKILRNYAREEHAFIWADFWETFKKNFGKAMLIGIIDIVVAAVIVFDLYMYTSLNSSAMVRTIALALMFITATIFIFMNYYIFPMLITFRLTFKQLIKNAFIFAWVGFFRNLFVTVLIAALTLIAVLYFPTFGYVYVLLIYFSLCGFIINFATYPLIKRYMIDGYDPNTGERLEDTDNDESDEE